MSGASLRRASRVSQPFMPLCFTCPNDVADKCKLPAPELYLPPNLDVTGTVNVDETTHAFSP